MSESDTSEKAQLTEAFSKLKATIGKDMEITEGVREEMRRKLNELEHGNQDELKEARKRITQLEKELMDRDSMSDKSIIENLKSQLSNQISSEIRSLSMKLFDKQREISSQTNSRTSNTYSALSNLVVEAGEVIQDIQYKLILDEQTVNDMDNSKIQKLIRDNDAHANANEKLMSLKVDIRNELGSTRDYPDTLQREAKEAIESLTETKKQLDNTLRMLEVEASERKIKFSKLDTDTSKFYKAPIFKGESAEGLNIFEFFEELNAYLQAIDISPDEYGAVLKKSLQGKALNIVNKVFPNTQRSSMAEVKDLLIKHFGKPENILASLKAKHEEIGKIPNTGDGDMEVVYKRSSDHACHIQKALMLEDNGCQVEFPKAYIDTIEKMLPEMELDKHLSWEIKNENAPNRKKLENLKSLIDEIEAKGLLKSSLSSLPTTSKASFYEEPQDDNSDQESTSKASIYGEPQDDNSDKESTSCDDWYSGDNDEDDEEAYYWFKPAYH